MTRISSKKLLPRIQNQMFYLFWRSLADLKSSRDLEFLSYDLFSKTERIMIAKRFTIAILLYQKFSFRKICSVLKVSPNTVNSVAKKIGPKHKGYLLIKVLIRNPEIQRILASF